MSPLTLSEPVTPATAPVLPTRRLFTYDPVERILLMDIDNTSLEHFAVCARSAEYRLVHSREGTAGTTALAYGSAKHLYLEHRLRGGSVAEAEELMVAALPATPDDPANWRTATHAVDSMRGYENWWHAAPIEPVVLDGEPLVEVGFRLPLCEVAIGGGALNYSRLLPLLTNSHECPIVPSMVRVHWTGRIDAVAPFLGDNYVVDHKTTSMAGPSFYDEFNLSSQMHGYVWASRHLWPSLGIRGLRVNAIIGRAPSKTGVAHAYERQTYIYSEEHLAEWHRDTQTLVSDFLAHLIRDYFPKADEVVPGTLRPMPVFPGVHQRPGVPAYRSELDPLPGCRLEPPVSSQSLAETRGITLRRVAPPSPMTISFPLRLRRAHLRARRGFSIGDLSHIAAPFLSTTNP